MKYFYSVPEAAKEVGLSTRHVERFATEHNIKPISFGKKAFGAGSRHRYTKPQVEELKRLRAK